MSLAFTEKKSDIQIINSQSITVSRMEKVLKSFLRRDATNTSLSGNESAIYEKLLAGIKQTQSGTGTETNK